MGSDAVCTLKFDGKTSRGTAWLEHKDLVFRGPVRLAIPLATIRAATARDGTLHVEFGDSSADFTIGSAAEKWAKRITSPPSRLDKLGVKQGMTIAAIAIRDEAFLVEAAGRAEKIMRRLPGREPSRRFDLLRRRSPGRAWRDCGTRQAHQARRCRLDRASQGASARSPRPRPWPPENGQAWSTSRS